MKTVKGYTLVSPIDTRVSIYEKNGEKYVLKKQDSLETPETITLCRLKNKRIVQLEEVITDLPIPLFSFIKRYYAVLEFIPGQNLNEYRRHAEIDNNTFFKYSLALIEAVKYIHSKGLVYNDLKPHNIMRSTKDNDLKMVDFKRPLDMSINQANALDATPGWRCQELINGFNEVSNDVFGLGSVIYFLEKGISPYLEYTNADYLKYMRKEKKLLEKGPASKLEKNSEISEVVNSMLDPKGQNRPSIDEVEKVFRAKAPI